MIFNLYEMKASIIHINYVVLSLSAVYPLIVIVALLSHVKQHSHLIMHTHLITEMDVK